MEIDKDPVVQLLRSKAQDAKADQARNELPDKVAPEQNSDLLSQVGIDPQELLGNLGGGGFGKVRGG